MQSTEVNPGVPASSTHERGSERSPLPPHPILRIPRPARQLLGYRAVELAPPEIHTLRVATRHRGYTHTVFTFFADAVADLIRPLIAEPAHAQIVPL
jgi:hypothetical protein